MHFIKDMFDEQIRKMEENDLYELQMMELEMEEILMELKTVSFALNKNIEDTIRETETRCAIKLYDAECAVSTINCNCSLILELKFKKKFPVRRIHVKVEDRNGVADGTFVAADTRRNYCL